MKARGFAQGAVLAVIGLIAVVLWVVKPKALDKASKQAATSTATTTALVTAQDKQGATAAASVVKIGEANTLAPDSPAKDFIAREVPVALASLPAPDAQALIAAEQRKAAILAGKLELATTLYDGALKRADANQAALNKALLAKQRADLALETTAAEALGATRERNTFILVAVVAVCLWLYVKFTHVSPGALAQAVTDIKAQAAGAPSALPAIVALDSVTTRLQQRMVSFLAHLKARVPS